MKRLVFSILSSLFVLNSFAQDDPVVMRGVSENAVGRSVRCVHD